MGRKSTLPPAGAERVKHLRAAGRSWSEVGRELGCSPWAARKAVA